MGAIKVGLAAVILLLNAQLENHFGQSARRTCCETVCFIESINLGQGEPSSSVKLHRAPLCQDCLVGVGGAPNTKRDSCNRAGLAGSLPILLPSVYDIVDTFIHCFGKAGSNRPWSN